MLAFCDILREFAHIVVNRMQHNVTGRFGGRSPTDFLSGSAREERKSKRAAKFEKRAKEAQ